MEDSTREQNCKKISKRNRELHKLEREMKDGTDLKGLERSKRARRGGETGWK